MPKVAMQSGDLGYKGVSFVGGELIQHLPYFKKNPTACQLGKSYTKFYSYPYIKDLNRASHDLRHAK